MWLYVPSLSAPGSAAGSRDQDRRVARALRRVARLACGGDVSDLVESAPRNRKDMIHFERSCAMAVHAPSGISRDKIQPFGPRHSRANPTTARLTQSVGESISVGPNGICAALLSCIASVRATLLNVAPVCSTRQLKCALTILAAPSSDACGLYVLTLRAIVALAPRQTVFDFSAHGHSL